MGSRRQLGVDEELTLNQLRNQLSAEPRNQEQTADQQDEGNSHCHHRVPQYTVKQPRIEGGDPLEPALEQRQGNYRQPTNHTPQCSTHCLHSRGH